MSAPLRVQLAALRARRGLGVSQLAERAGISRQALSAIESGRSVPSTTVALALARALDCRVEELFALAPDRLPGPRWPELAGKRVAVGQVAGRWVAHGVEAADPGPADGLVEADGTVRLLEDPRLLERTVLVAGCAPVLGVLAGVHGRGEGRARWVQGPSSRSLQWLAEGRVHLAGVHLADRDAPGDHDRLARARLPGESLSIVGLVGWREGLVTAPGNPLGIRSAADLGRKGLRIARRPEGSGAARVLQRALERDAPGTLARGPEVATHADAAAAVRFGAADVAVVVEPLAEALGLPFLPISEERFELVVRSEHLDHPEVERLLDRLSSPRFAAEVRGMGAYDLAGVGALRVVA